MPHPRYLGRMLSAADIAEWQEFAALRPFGERGADIRAAAQIAARFELHRDESKRPSRFRWENYLHWLEPAPPVTQAELDADAQVEAFDRMFGVR